MKMDNKTYDILKFIALKVLPALATLIIVLTMIWDIPYGEAIGATITAIDGFLGTILGISSKNYAKEQALEEMHEADVELANSPLYPEDENGGE